MAAGFVQPPVLVAAGCAVLAAVNCAISSADLTACALEGGGAVNVSAVAAVAAPRNPGRVAFPDGSFDMQHFLFVACEMLSPCPPAKGRYAPPFAAYHPPSCGCFPYMRHPEITASGRAYSIARL